VEKMEGFHGNVVVLNADKPLFTQASVAGLVHTHQATAAAITLTTATVGNPTGYGRIVRSEWGTVQAVIEEKEATEAQKTIREINGGAYCFDLSQIQEYLDLLPQHGSDNSHGRKHEVFLTDIVRLSAAGGKRVSAYRSPDPDIVLGVNTLAQRELVEALVVKKRGVISS